MHAWLQRIGLVAMATIAVTAMAMPVLVIQALYTDLLGIPESRRLYLEYDLSRAWYFHAIERTLPESRVRVEFVGRERLPGEHMADMPVYCMRVSRAWADSGLTQTWGQVAYWIDDRIESMRSDRAFDAQWHAYRCPVPFPSASPALAVTATWQP